MTAGEYITRLAESAAAEGARESAATRQRSPRPPDPIRVAGIGDLLHHAGKTGFTLCNAKSVEMGTVIELTRELNVVRAKASLFVCSMTSLCHTYEKWKQYTVQNEERRNLENDTKSETSVYVTNVKLSLPHVPRNCFRCIGK